MWKLLINRERLLQFGFVHNNKEQQYYLEIDEDGGNIYINDSEDFFRIDQYCFETPDGKDDTYIPEHIATLDDEWRIEPLANAGITMWMKD